MNEDFFLLDIPDYFPEYDNRKQYGFNGTKVKRNLLYLLCRESEGYCMYCYNTIKVNGNIYADLEHGIEKSIDKDKFEECIPNISISCSKCNQKYKRRGESRRKSYMCSINLDVKTCKRSDCKRLCHEMEQMRKEYIENGKILVRPFENYLSRDRKLQLQYDLLNAKYIPSKKFDYTEKEIEIIRGHINIA